MPVHMFIYIDRHTGEKFVKYGCNEPYARYSPIGPDVPAHAVLYQSISDFPAYISILTYDINDYWHNIIHKEYIYR